MIILQTASIFNEGIANSAVSTVILPFIMAFFIIFLIFVGPLLFLIFIGIAAWSKSGMETKPVRPAKNYR